MIVKIDELRQTAAAILVNLGEEPHNAEIASTIMVWADARGVATHGTYLLTPIARRAKAGMIQLPTRVTTISDNSGTGVLDGNNGLGQVAACRAMETSIEKAKRSGLAVTVVRNTNNIGSLGYYSLMAANEGMIGLAMANAAPAIAPWGGAEAFMGTNPFSIGVPTFNECPLIADMSSSVVARGKIRAASRKRMPIPPGWALDENGDPTEDPDLALKGTLLPMGGPKGAAMALIVDIFAGMLSGSKYGPGVKTFHELTGNTGAGAFCMAIKVDEFMADGVFKKLINDHLAAYKKVKRAKGIAEIFLPGEIESHKELASRQNGVEIDPQVMEGLQEMLGRVARSGEEIS